MAAAAIGPAVQGFSKLLSSLFAGMQVRAKQAANENQALNGAVRGFDSDLGAIINAYNTGQVDGTQAAQAVGQAYQNYWALITPYIQPNRNGCSSGANCPGYRNSGYIACGPAQGGSITIGASCCVGCGPIRKAVEDVSAAFQAGGGTVNVLAIGGDKYGLQTRLGYQVVIQRGAAQDFASEITTAVDGLNLQSASGVSYSTTGNTNSLLPSALGLQRAPTGGFVITSTTVLVIVAILTLFAALGFVGRR